MGRTRKNLAWGLLLVVGSAIVLVGTEHKPASSDLVSSRLQRLEIGMPIDEVRQILGMEADYRTDAGRAIAERHPLMPFRKPDSTRYGNEKLLMVVSRYGMFDAKYWHWDDGSIGIALTEDTPQRVLDKRLHVADGPRGAIECAADPLRSFVYKHVDNRQYNVIWSAVIFFFVVATLLFFLCRLLGVFARPRRK